MRRLFLVLAFVAAACSADAVATPSGGAAPAGSVESQKPGEPVSPGPTDDADSAKDASSTQSDSGSKADSGGGPFGDILGTLSGSCGLVRSQLTTTTPSFYENLLVFVAGESYDKASLSSDGDRLFDTANAGGSSTESETMSFEILRYCENAKLLKTETEILYAPPDDSGPNSITDYLAEINGLKIGVSVTRAYRPSNIAFPDSDVKALLEKKLEGVVRSSQRVLAADKWQKQILHVWTANKDETDAVVRVLPTIDGSIRADTIVLLTETTGGGFIYCNPDPALGSECP